MAPTRAPAPPRNRLGRLTLILIVAAAAAAAVALNHHGRPSDIHDWTGVQMNGRTSQGKAIFAVERKGALRAIYMTWRMRCDDGTSYAVGAQFREPFSTFQHSGRDFTVGVVQTIHGSRLPGRVTDSARVRGTVSTSLRSAQGVAERTNIWHRAGGPVTCRSGSVHWRVRMPGDSHPN